MSAPRKHTPIIITTSRSPLFNVLFAHISIALFSSSRVNVVKVETTTRKGGDGGALRKKEEKGGFLSSVVVVVVCFFWVVGYWTLREPIIKRLFPPTVVGSHCILFFAKRPLTRWCNATRRKKKKTRNFSSSSLFGNDGAHRAGGRKRRRRRTQSKKVSYYYCVYTCREREETANR